MSIHYPMQQHGQFGLGMGITFEVLHERFGFDLGERYHADFEHRIRTNREMWPFTVSGKTAVGRSG